MNFLAHAAAPSNPDFPGILTPFLSFAQREIHFSDHSDGITSRSFWPQRLLDARNGTGQVLCMFTQLSLLHTGWVVERFHQGRKASEVWGQNPTQLCPVLEHLSLVPDPPLPSAGPTAALPERNGYCVFGLVGWFGFLVWFGLIWGEGEGEGLLFFFFRYLYVSLFLFLPLNPPKHTSLLSYKLMTSFSLVVATCIYVYISKYTYIFLNRYCVLLGSLKLQMTGSAVFLSKEI